MLIRLLRLSLPIGLLGACSSSPKPPDPVRPDPAALAPQPRRDLELTVRVTGLRSDQGNVFVALFASERGFPTEAEHALRTELGSIHQNAAEVRFPGLARGRYAVSVLHDENANGRLDTGFLGIPSEGLGASNAAQGRFGAARHEKAEFTLDTTSAISITVRYFP
jgi:uncharacterized protein (DUF2141 family)